MERSTSSKTRRVFWSALALSFGVVGVSVALKFANADSFNRTGRYRASSEQETGESRYGTPPTFPAQADRRSQYGTPRYQSPQFGSKSRDETDDRTGDNSDRETRNVRFFFTHADWATVLKKVADSSDSTLVMREVPPGRYSKYLARKVSRKEAVRVLNRDLEQKGFRIVEKGKFLDVLHLRSARSEYHRPELPSHRDWQSRNTQPRKFADERPIQKYERRVTQISRRTIKPAANKPSRQSHGVRNANAVGPWADLIAPKKVVEEPPVTRTVRTRNRRAIDIARAIYRPLKSRSKLVDAGPSGLPAFEIKQTPSPVRQQPTRKIAGKVLFTIGIDSKRNELVVKAPPKRNRDVVELIEYLDGVELANHETLQVVPTQADPTAIAKTLRPQLALLAQNQPVQPKQPAGKEAVAPGGGNGVIPVIQGRVTIRDVPGVGLVVTGNKDDVEAVLRIIRELDKQGLVTAPNVALHQLQHVNSQAVAELLTAVYAQLATIRSGQKTTVGTVGFIPVVRPNALLVISSRADLPAILKLIGELDRPVDPEKEYRVFHLKHQVASQVVANLDALFQQAATGTNANANTRGLSSRVRAIADVRSNAVIIEAAPNDMKVVAQLIAKLDAENIGSISRVKIIRLKNAVATELAELVNNAIQSVIGSPTTSTGGQIGGTGGQSSQALRDARSSILEFMVPDDGRKKLIRSGILSDIRVTADPRINALVITAPDQSMQLLEQLISSLDQPSALVAEIKVFTLANGDATSMLTLLQSMFPTQQTGQAGQQAQAGFQTVGSDDASSSLIPLRFSVDARTNSIIAIGGAEALRVVEAVVFRLDESDIRQRQTTVIRLRNAPVIEVSTSINNFLTSQRNLAQIDPNIVTNMELLEREIIVVPESVSNSLLVSATPRFFEEIKRIIARLDQAPPQVVIQALIVEVTLDNTDEFGVELGFQDPLLFARGLASDLVLGPETTTTAPNGVQTTNQAILSQARTPGFSFNNNNLGTNASANPSSVGTQGLSNLALGRVNGELGFGGLVLSAQSSSISALLRAMAAKRTVQVLSRPQITALDNQPAEISVGQSVPRITSVTPGTATTPANPTTTPTDIGIILRVTPRVRQDNTIVMQTFAQSSSLSGQGVPIFTDLNTGNTVESPIFNQTTATTTVAVPNGQTIVLGGLITKNDDTIERKVPWLGDIPILKYAFRYDSTRTRRTELLIFLTPRIVRDDADAEAIKQIEAERMHFIEKDAEAVHGPLFAVPADRTESNIPKPVTLNRRGDGNIPSMDFDDSKIPTARNLRPISYQSQDRGPSVTGSAERRRSTSRDRSFMETTRKSSGEYQQESPYQKKKKRGLFSFPWSK